MVIDIHTHAFADAVAKSAIPALERECGVAAVHNGTLAGLAAQMETGGIGLSVVQPVATKPAQVGTINQWAKKNRSARQIIFGALHPDDPDVLHVAAQLKADGFLGVKLHPDYQHFLADEPRMMPIYRALADLGLVLMLHAGVDIGLPGRVHCTPYMISRVVREVPALKLIAAHMGGHALWHDADQLLAGQNLYFDTSYSMYQLGPAEMARMIRRHGAHRVLFGSDSPWRSAGEAKAQIAALDLPPADIDRILWQNAQALLGLRE